MLKSEVGKIGEDIALEFLLNRGMRLLERNWHSGHKELDLVMEDDNFIRFVEVRCRSYPNDVNPAETVNLLKQRKVILAACGFLKNSEIKKKLSGRLKGKECVFDVVSILINGEFYKIEYIKEAFGPTW